jgi:RNA polymerase sigma factor (TIGR02999 family)
MTQLDVLDALRGGRREALDGLTAVLYDELREIAHRHRSRQGAEASLVTTALVHEAYLKLVDHTKVEWTDRAHFFAVAAHVTRCILVDYGRRQRAAKRGGGDRRVPLDDVDLPIEERAELLVALDEALGRLAALNSRLAQVVECRYFGGLSDAETAAALGVTERTVQRDWAKAKAWLYQELKAKG